MHQHYLDCPEHKVRYDVNRRVDPAPFLHSIRLRNIIDFATEEAAIAFIGNCESYFGDDLRIDEVDEETGDSTCVFSAELDNELGRYLN